MPLVWIGASMRTWLTSPVPLRCGCCGQDIPSGVRHQLVQLSGLRRALRRCAGCAGDTPAREQPDAQEPAARRLAPDFTKVGDVKLQQAGR